VSDETRKSVRIFIDAYRNRDFDIIAGLIDDNIDWTIHGPVEVFPFVGGRRGRAAVLQAMGDIATACIVDKYVPRVHIVEGDKASVIIDETLIQRSTGRVIRIVLAQFMQFDRGKLAVFHEFFDTFDVVEQALGRWLDVSPPGADDGGS
jgi:ketosteroid isomerase-like protein